MEDYVARHGYGLLAALINAMVQAIGYVPMPTHQANAFAYEVHNSQVMMAMYRLQHGSSYKGTIYTHAEAFTIWRMSQTLCKIVKLLPTEEAIQFSKEILA